VVLFATNEKQIDQVLYPELRNLYAMAKARGYDLLAGGSVMAEDPQTGIEALDGRVIRGLSGHKTEAFGGISGAHLMFIIDEASSLTQRVFEAILGNTRGSRRERLARVYAFGNPLNPEGPFYTMFHEEKHIWDGRHVSSLDVARQAESLGIDIPGLATTWQCESDIEKMGKDSPWIITRIFGQFLRHETGKVNPYHIIRQAQERWESARDDVGRLAIGVDPAGPKNEGDEWGFASTRGYKCLEIETRRGLTPEQGVAKVEELISRHRRGDEIPIVIVDTLGEDGWKFYSALRERAEWIATHDYPNSFEVVRFRGSDKATRGQEWYERERDVLWAWLSKWLRDGGAIPSDYKLETELHALKWHVDVNGKYYVTKKEGSGGLRQILNRSPDRADGLALSVYRPATALPAEENPHGEMLGAESYGASGTLEMDQMAGVGSSY
jgi:phage terminase large subunit